MKAFLLFFPFPWKACFPWDLEISICWAFLLEKIMLTNLQLFIVRDSTSTFTWWTTYQMFFNIRTWTLINGSYFHVSQKLLKSLSISVMYLVSFSFSHPIGLFTRFSGIIGLLKHITSLFISLAELVMQCLITLDC